MFKIIYREDEGLHEAVMKVRQWGWWWSMGEMERWYGSGGGREAFSCAGRCATM
jgi:uncharacterized protein